MTSPSDPRTLKRLAIACVLSAGMLFSVAAPAVHAAPATPISKPTSDTASAVQGESQIILDILANDATYSEMFILDHASVAFVDAAGNKVNTLTANGMTHTIVRNADGTVAHDQIDLNPAFNGTTEVTYGWNNYVEMDGVRYDQGFQTATITVTVTPSGTPVDEPTEAVVPNSTINDDFGKGTGDAIVSIDIHANDVPSEGGTIVEADTLLISDAGVQGTEVQVANGTHKLVADADGGYSYQFVPVAGFKGGTTETVNQVVSDSNGAVGTATISVQIAAVEETPVEETPAEEIPVEETPVEEVPVEEIPEETPVEEVPDISTVPVTIPTENPQPDLSTVPVNQPADFPVSSGDDVFVPTASMNEGFETEELALTGVQDKGSMLAGIGGVLLMIGGGMLALKARVAKHAGAVRKH